MGRYGYRRIKQELHNRGYTINDKTLQRLMKALGIVCKVRMKLVKLLQTYLKETLLQSLMRNGLLMSQGLICLDKSCIYYHFLIYTVKILFLHHINRPVLSMITDMLKSAFYAIPDNTNLILHSDKGWQYQHKQYQRILKEKGIRQSMRRKGNSLDNAVIENFFGLLKSELLYLQEIDSIKHFKLELEQYLDYYNNRRIELKLNGLAPAKHRYQAIQVA